MTTVVLTDLQKVPVGITVVDLDGQAVVLAAPPSWASSDAAVAQVLPAADGLSAVVTSGTVGEADITVSLGDGSLSDVLHVSVINSAPGSLNLTVGVPEAE